MGVSALDPCVVVLNFASLGVLLFIIGKSFGRYALLNTQMMQVADMFCRKYRQNSQTDRQKYRQC